MAPTPARAATSRATPASATSALAATTSATATWPRPTSRRQATTTPSAATSDVDYCKFTVPTGMTGNLSVAVQSSGLSLLDPTLKIFDSKQHQLGSTVSGSGYSGCTIQGTANVTAGSTYYVMVDGKDSTA